MGSQSASIIVSWLDVIGTLAFAVSGAMLGVRRQLDLFGVLVLGFVTAVFGGVTRDVLLGRLPPPALADGRALGLSVLAGLASFFGHRWLERLKEPVAFFDAAGLGLFAVTGTRLALERGMNWPMAAVLGVLSGVGGGVARDVLTAQVPTVLFADVYAVAALAGALVVIFGAQMGLPPSVTALGGAILCVSLRLLALYRGWRLPTAKLDRSWPRSAGESRVVRERVDDGGDDD